MSSSTLFISFPRWQLVVRFEAATAEIAAAVASRWDGIIVRPPADECASTCSTVRFVREPPAKKQSRSHIAFFHDDERADREAVGLEEIEGPTWTLRFEHGKGSAVTAIPGASQPAFERVAGALELALIHALALRGSSVIHACCFTFGGRSVVALGPSNAGKSTLAAAVLVAGGAVVSDDSVVVGLREGDRLHASFFRSALIFRAGAEDCLLRGFAGFLRPIRWSNGVRWAIPRHRLGASALPLTGVDEVWLLVGRQGVVSAITGRPSSAEVLSSVAQGGAPLFLSARFPAERVAAMPALRFLAERIPRYSVSLGPDLLQQPLEVIRGVLESTALNPLRASQPH